MALQAIRSRLGFAVVLFLALLTGPNYAQQAESQDRTENILNGVAMGALMSSSIASIPGGILAPYPVSLGFEIAGYSADLGLVNTGPVFQAPRNLTVTPNAVLGRDTFCKYRFSEAVNVDYDGDVPALTSDYSSIFYINYKPLEDNFSDLGVPRQLYHANADVAVSASNPNLGAATSASRASQFRTQPEFPSGVHRIDWEARTQMNLVFDVAIPTALLGFAGYSEFKTAQKVATGAVKASVKNDFIKQGLFAVGKELGLLTGNLLLQDLLAATTVPTTANFDTQFITVYDTTGPYFSLPNNPGTPINRQALESPLEATDFGGVRLARVQQLLRSRFDAVDDCGEALSLSLDTDINTLLPTGEESRVDWNLTEVVNGPFQPGYQPVRGQRFDNNILINELVQFLTVEDTQAPLLVPPAGFAAERNSPLPVSTILSRDFPVGEPLVTDLADATPVTDFTIAGAPLQLELDRRYVLNWFSVDDSGNSTAAGPLAQGQFEQLVTLKSPNTNTTPTAFTASGSGVTSRPIEITLTGSDPDVLPVVGRGVSVADPLAFMIKDYPDNGEFEAPLYPYFIHDYRLTPNGEAEEGDNLSRVSPLGPLAAEFSNQSSQSFRSSFLTDNICTTTDSELLARFNRVIPLDFVYAPKLIQVLDDGNVYMLDEFFYCGTRDGDAGLRAIPEPRLSLWSQGGELLAMQAIQAQQAPGSGSAVRPAQWVIDEPQTTRFNFSGRKLVFDNNDDLLVTLWWIDGGNGDLCTRTYSVDADLAEAAARGRQCGQRGLNLAFPQGPIADSLNGVNIMVSQADPSDGPDAPDVIRVYDARFDNFYGEDGLIGIIRVPDPDMTAYSVATDSLGSVYILDRPDDRVHKFSPTKQLPNGEWALGEHVGWMGKCDLNGRNAAGVPFNACDEERHVSLGYSCTEEKCKIESTDTTATSGTLEGQLRDPQQIAVDPNDILYVADFGNDRIQRFGPDGTFAGSAASEGDGFVIGNFGRPSNVSVNSGSMFVLESFSPFFDVFLHSFKTLPFFDVTADSAKVKYRSHFDHQGPDSFTYAVSDGISESAPVGVDLFLTRAFRSPRNLTVTCYAQQPPAPFTDCTTAEDGEGLYVELSASDPDGFLSTGGLDSLTFTIEQAPEHGTLEEIDQGTDSAQVYLYTPAVDYHGSDQFEFSVSDGVNSAASDAPAPLFVSPTPDPVMVEFDDDLVAPRGFPFTLVAQYSDVDANEVVPQLLALDWGDGVAATLENGFADSGRVDLNGQELDPQLHFGQGRGAVVGTHTYVSPGLRTIAIELSNAAENIDQPTRQTARINVQDAVFTAAQVTAPMEPVDPDQPFALNIEVTNLTPMGGDGLAAINTVASFDLPPGVTLISGDSRCTGSAEISCSLGTIDSGASTTISMQASIGLASARDETRYELSIKLTDAGPKIGDMSMGFGALEIADSDLDSVIDVDDAFDNDPRYSLDSDGDGLPDAWELAFGYDPQVADNPLSDEDGDGISLLEEFVRGSFPQLADGSRVIEDVTLRATTPESEDFFGIDIVHADFDQDGFSDFVIGGSRSDVTGQAIVYYGRADAEPLPQVLLPPDSAARDFGESMVVADFDGNGRADLLVNSTSGAYVYYNDGALPSEPSTTVSVTTGGEARTAFAVGDLDNDGIDDLVSSYRRPGTNSRGIQLFLSANDPEVLSGEQFNPLEAAPVVIEDERPYTDHEALVFDLDGDGLNDLLLAGSQTGVERVNLYFGSSKDWNNPGSFVPTRVLSGPPGQGRFGWSMAGGIDLGGDGIADLVVGSIGASGVDEAGWVNIYDSADAYWNQPPAERLPSQTLAGRAGRIGANDARGDAFGAEVVLAQISDDDTVSLIVGASRAGAEDTGEVHIYRATGSFDNDVPFNPTPVQIIEGRPATFEAENDRNSVFGRPIAAVGDVDGDGVNDLAIAAPGFGVGATPTSGFVRLFLHGYSPLNDGQDADGDGVRDTVDNCPALANTDRANADGDAFGNACDDDDDNDQLTDAYEIIHGLDPLRFDADEDLDGDGLTNLDEFMRMLSPSDPDTDRDGIDDGAEIAAGTDPLFADTDADGIINTVDLDDDADGVTDTMELLLGLDPLDALDALGDSDGDGFSNLAELQANSDVNDMGSMPEIGAFSRLFASVLPGHRSTQSGNAVTAFATIINTTDETAEGCSIVPLRPFDARWSFTPTDAATNVPNAPGNTPVAIEAGAAQSYIFEIEPEAVMSDELELRFDCGNTAPVNTIVGLNTFGLTVANEPLVDMVALTATLSGDGILRLPGAGGSGAFAVASVNVGATGTVTARVRSANGLPLVVGICETDTATGLCVNNQVPRADWLVDVAANATPTFSVFATSTGDIPLDPANNRIVVEFLNAGGDRVGASSVAVSTQ